MQASFFVSVCFCAKPQKITKKNTDSICLQNKGTEKNKNIPKKSEWLSDNIGRTFKDISVEDLIVAFKNGSDYRKKVWELFVKKHCWYSKETTMERIGENYLRPEFCSPSGIKEKIEDYEIDESDPIPEKVFNFILNFIEFHILNDACKVGIHLQKDDDATPLQILKALKDNIECADTEIHNNLNCWKKIMRTEINLKNNTMVDEISEYDENKWIAENLESISTYQCKYVIEKLKTMSFNEKNVCFKEFLKHNPSCYPDELENFFACD